MSDRDERGQAGFQDGELGGGLRPPGVGRGYGRDYGAGGRNQGFDGSWGQGYGGSLRAGDYRDPSGGDAYGGGVAGEDYARSFGGRGGDIAADAGHGTSQAGPHGGRGPAGWNRSDARLLEDVSEALMEDRLLDAREIEVRVVGGVVTLTGEVPGASDVRLAEQIVRRCRGVQDVRTELQVHGQRRPDLGVRPDTPNPFHPPGQDHAVTSTERNAQLGDTEDR
jgi:hypothetical protein